MEEYERDILEFEGSQDDDPDLEDGEIASDEEAPPEAAAQKTEKPEAVNKMQQKVEDDFVNALQKLREDVARKKEAQKDRPPRKTRFDNNDRRVGKKRKQDEEVMKRKEKRQKVDGEKEDEEMDEDEMLGLCVRGASPTLQLDKTAVWPAKQPILDPEWQMYDNNEYDSDFDERKRKRGRPERRGGFKNLRDDREVKKRIQMKRKGKNRKDMDNSDMICINFMKGNCNKGNDCFYSHAVCPPKKMELCKFYLMDCCAKRDKCLYLHDEFPCKFYHTGLKCYQGKKCKFSHDPLNSLSKDILLKHLENAPKDILGDFPRLSRESAETMVNSKTAKPAAGDQGKIPSLFDIQVSIPPQFQAGEGGDNRETPPCSPPPGVKSSPPSNPKESINFYPETEAVGQDRGGPMDFAKELEAYKTKQMLNKAEAAAAAAQEAAPSAWNDDEVAGQAGNVEERQEEDRERRKKRERKKSKRRDEEEGKKSRKERKRDADKCPVSVAEDGTFGGIKFKIINRKEIRKSAESDEREREEQLLPMKIEKPSEFLSSDDERPLNYLVTKKEPQSERGDEGDKFGVEVKQEGEDETDENETDNQLVIETNDDPDEDHPSGRDDGEEDAELVVPRHLPRKQQELFLRIQTQQHGGGGAGEHKGRAERPWGVVTEAPDSDKSEGGRTPDPDPADENWYSSDDEDRREPPLAMALQNVASDKKPVLPQPSTESRSLTPPPKPKFDLPAISDFSKINITELLSSIRQVTAKNTQGEPAAKPAAAGYEAAPAAAAEPVKMNFYQPEAKKKEVKDPRLRDPRDPRTAEPKRRPSDDKKSIYDCANFTAEPRQDSDLRLRDSDERVSCRDPSVPFGDVDLRSLPGDSNKADGDFDLRKFGLPFKPVPVHTAATEIDASLNSHAPINYRVEEILIPRPDFSSIKIQANDPQVRKDPRLRRLFRVSSSDAEPREEPKKSSVPTDPRQRKQPIADTPKSPDTPFSPKSDGPPSAGLPNQNILLALAQLGLTAAAGTNMFDPRLQQVFNKNPQEMEMLRNQIANMKSPADMEMLRNQIMGGGENPEMMRGPGLLPTPGGMGVGLLGPAPPFMMGPGMGMPDPSMMMGPMGPMAPPNMGFDPRFNNGPNDEGMNDTDIRHGGHGVHGVHGYNRGGFRGDRRGRGSWRGNRDRTWDNRDRRHRENKREDRGRHRDRGDRGDRGDRDDRRERRRSNTPPD